MRPHVMYRYNISNVPHYREQFFPQNTYIKHAHYIRAYKNVKIRSTFPQNNLGH